MNRVSNIDDQLGIKKNINKKNLKDIEDLSKESSNLNCECSTSATNSAEAASLLSTFTSQPVGDTDLFVVDDKVSIRGSYEYIESLKGRNLKVFLFGKLIDPVNHPIVQPSINAVAETYDLAERQPELATVKSSIINKPVNRFLHITTSPEDVANQNLMQRRLGQLTGTCFQRCVGMDAINSLYSTTFDIDKKYGTTYHLRFMEWLKKMQLRNFVICGAMTDPKGDRGLPPSKQPNPDVFLRIVSKNEKGIIIRGAKLHQTGGINSHWMVVMPTLRLQPSEKDYAVVASLPVHHPSLVFVYGRQSCDTRSMETWGNMDCGNVKYGGQEVTVLFNNVFIPYSHVFMDGETEFASVLVDRFTSYHRRSYVCKAGVGDVLIGAAAAAAEYNGVENASHIKDKLVEMTHLNETIYGTGMAASLLSTRTEAGNFQPDDKLANVCKHQVTRVPFEMARLAQDLAGGLMVTGPSEADLNSPEVGHALKQLLKGKVGTDAEDRIRILRLVENMTLGRNAVGYLTESLHGAGSPQAQRIQLLRSAQLDKKKAMARRLAGVKTSSKDNE
eukprot:NODE_1848_length_1784_cov_43.593618_g1568_i0.p1 GENE.NODE_1848_length_1784_cov_43.593618_g1568_i0~~NODE_1848_length_1784_cov_43.593618_g1568_i0.p1  ORF type:complete len:575 (+),score=126.56 NODE_1848_length_1784_cov_43.593618_g1568_i0:51-1727(+)